MECAAEVPNGLACVNSCEKEAIALDEIVQKSKSAYAKTGTAYKRNAVIYLVAGVFFVFLCFSAYFSDDGKSKLLFFLPLAAVFLYGAYGNFRTGIRINQPHS
jgi:hypothetical protein